MRKSKYPYEEYHKTENGTLYKLCATCRNWFPCTLEYFYINRSNKADGLHPECRECSKNRAHAYLKAHPEWNNERTKRIYAENRFNQRERERKCARAYRQSDLYKKWCAENQDRLRKYRENHKFHDITDEEWQHCKDYFNNACAYCGLPIEEHFNNYRDGLKLYDLHKEHVFLDGGNYIENCVPACRQCNSSKRIYDFESWYKAQPFYTEERYNRIISWIMKDSLKET